MDKTPQNPTKPSAARHNSLLFLSPANLSATRAAYTHPAHHSPITTPEYLCNELEGPDEERRAGVHHPLQVQHALQQLANGSLGAAICQAEV